MQKSTGRPKISKRLRLQKVGAFTKLLFRWRGSVFKLVWKELLVYLILYSFLSLLYRFALHQEQRILFEKICQQVSMFIDWVPVGFVLGFYVTLIVERWWARFQNVPWLSRLAHVTSVNISGNDADGRVLRRTILRYANLSTVLTFRSISISVKKRFPTDHHLIQAGFITEEELKTLRNTPSPIPKYWVPFAWIVNVIRYAEQQKRITSAPSQNLILQEVNSLRDMCDRLYHYDWVGVPLAYTQVVTIAVYSFFAACLFSRQFLDPESKYGGEYHTIVDFYFPIYTVLEFIFYVGWLKVAENLMDPFEEDDDDYDLHSVVDTNFQVSLMIVDYVYSYMPTLVKDAHFNEIAPELPYTKVATKRRYTHWMGSAQNVTLSKSKMEISSVTPKKGLVIQHLRDRVKLVVEEQKRNFQGIEEDRQTEDGEMIELEITAGPCRL